MTPEPIFDLAHLGHMELLTPKPDFAGSATLEVFEHSAKDGSVINLVRIPLTLRPSGATSGGERQLPDFSERL